MAFTMNFTIPSAIHLHATTTRERSAAPRPAASAKSYQPGDVVMHKVFGRGVVTRVTPAAGDFIVEIRFDKVGVKKTMANYAPLTKVSEG